MFQLLTSSRQLFAGLEKPDKDFVGIINPHLSVLVQYISTVGLGSNLPCYPRLGATFQQPASSLLVLHFWFYWNTQSFLRV